MKILWVCNKKPFDFDENGIGYGGGWIRGFISQMTGFNNMSFRIVYPGDITSDAIINGNISCQCLQSNKNNKKYDKLFYEEIKKLLNCEKYDRIHIWGTEFPHTLAVVDACAECQMLNKTLIWIQGLCSIYAKHYYGGLPSYAFVIPSLRDFIKGDFLINQKQTFVKRGKFEVLALKKCRHICGRTDWDRITVKQISPSVSYHFCNEVLQSEFYDHKWSLSACQKGRIFTSQATYPIKGLHKLLKALLELHSKYPFIELYVAGYNIIEKAGFKSLIHRTTYGSHILRYIKKHNMHEYVHFTGELSPLEMAEQYKLANIFVMPSAIENSPNSLGEAMLIGTPIVASDVGGVKNMLLHNEDGFVYPFEEDYMLAGYIEELLNDDALAVRFSESARKHALVTHNQKKNAETLMKIYEELGG